jgi:type IV secretion system protein VirD4
MDYVNDSNDDSSLASVITQNTSDQKRRGNDDFWKPAENSILSALILYVKETMPKEKQNLRSVLEIGPMCGDDPDAVDRLFKKLPMDSEARMAYRVFNQSEDKLRSSILTGLAFGSNCGLQKKSYH